MRPILFGAFCLALSLPANAQVVPRNIVVCDLIVNGYRVSWPPSILSKTECLTMLEAVRERDETEARIFCKCQTGDRT